MAGRRRRAVCCMFGARFGVSVVVVVVALSRVLDSRRASSLAFSDETRAGAHRGRSRVLGRPSSAARSRRGGLSNRSDDANYDVRLITFSEKALREWNNRPRHVIKSDITETHILVPDRTIFSKKSMWRYLHEQAHMLVKGICC